MLKLTLLINSNAGITCGWSETMYTSTTDPTAVRALTNNWMTRRARMLSSAFTIIGVRVSTVAPVVPTTSYFVFPTSQVTGLLAFAPDFPNTAVLISLRSGTNVEHRTLRGWPDSYIEAAAGQQLPVLTAAGLTLLGDYIAYLSSAALGWASLARLGDAGYVEVPIDAIGSPAPTNRAQYTGVFPGSMIGPNKGSVRVRGFKGEMAFLNGSFAPDSYGISATTLLSPTPATSAQIGIYVMGTSKVIKNVLSFRSVQGGSYERVSAHKTGRPSVQLRGRR